MLTRTVWSALGFLVLVIVFPHPLAAQDKPVEEVKLPAFLKARPAQAADGDDALRKLYKERYNAALKVAAARYLEFLAGRGSMEQFHFACRLLLRTELEMADKPAEKLTVREKFLTLAKEIEAIEEQRFEAGRASVADKELARVNRLTAEIELLQAKQQGQAPPK